MDGHYIFFFLRDLVVLIGDELYSPNDRHGSPVRHQKSTSTSACCAASNPSQEDNEKRSPAHTKVSLCILHSAFCILRSIGPQRVYGFFRFWEAERDVQNSLAWLG